MIARMGDSFRGALGVMDGDAVGAAAGFCDALSGAAVGHFYGIFGIRNFTGVGLS